jgi:hypothetical protein
MVRALTILLFLVALGVPLPALTVKPLSFSELVQESSAVVYGRVSEVRGQWTADRRGIESVVVVEASSYLKGDLGEEVTVRVPGGEAGGFVNIIPGTPKLLAGDRVVLFLKTSGPAIPVITGTSQGVFRVSTDPATGTNLVSPPVVNSAATTAPRGDSSRRPVSLAAFTAAVRGVEAAR